MATDSFHPPTAAHRRLRLLDGRWVGRETHHPFAGFPNVRHAEARIDGRFILGGLYLEREYTSSRDGVVLYRARGLYGWNEERQVYSLSWFDTSGVPPLAAVPGTWEPELDLGPPEADGEGTRREEPSHLVFRYRRGQKQLRMTYDFQNSERYVFRLESQPLDVALDDDAGAPPDAADESPWTPIFSGTYRRLPHETGEPGADPAAMAPPAASQDEDT